MGYACLQPSLLGQVDNQTVSVVYQACVLLDIAGNIHHPSAASSPSQFDKCPPESPDISTLSPELQQQWDVDKNMHLGAIKVNPHSTIKAVWKCDHCPAGQPHVWETLVKGRTRGAKCPYCFNKRVCMHNSLATIAPDVAQYWNHSKNERSPEQVLAGSKLRAEWKCPACNYEWQAPIAVSALVVPSAVLPAEPSTLSSLLPKLSLLSWLNGTMNAMTQRGSIHICSPWAAPRRCTGSAHAVQEGTPLDSPAI